MSPFIYKLSDDVLMKLVEFPLDIKSPVYLTNVFEVLVLSIPKAALKLAFIFISPPLFAKLYIAQSLPVCLTSGHSK